ncbi:XRE family transcriptional regulator [Mammaliicoccus lentus]|uniref:helix-turn-helix domain-containing protein n=1 Tax=Mammaliicoccus lentus TaxID=42858 RepID=UPI001C4E1E71|nr:XRE family transcriptional regulator [Mammaliicoccus lentus]MBW0769188.1 XRE family transcriptional regulator [Mammaliicoccus lentus]
MEKEQHLKNLIELKSGTVKSFSEEIGLAYTTVRSILERGILNAKVENVIKICRGLNIKPESLMQIDDSLISEALTTLIELKATRQKNVLNYAKEQLKVQNQKSTNISSINEYKIKYNNKEEKIPFTRIGTTGAGVGVGEELDDDIIEETVYFDRSEVDQQLLETADFCIYVNGDSMEPTIKRDTYSFVRRTNEIRDGLVSLVIYDSTVLIKKIELIDDAINLVSLNPRYETIKVKPHHQFKLIGKIVQ